MSTSFLLRVGNAVRHQWRIVCLVLIVGSSAAIAALLLTHPKFSATTSVLMVAEPPEATNPNIPTTATKPLLSADLPSLTTDATVLSRFRRDLGEDITFEKLRQRIHAKVGLDSTVMPITYTASSPQAAIRGANALGDEITAFYRQTATTRFDSLIADYNHQLAERKAELKNLDGELAKTAKNYPYIDVNVPGTPAVAAQSVYERLLAIRAARDESLATANADASAARATSRLIADALPLAQRDIVNSDVAYRGLRDQYGRDYAALKKLSAFGSSRYPGFLELQATVERDAAMTELARKQALAAGPSANEAYAAALDNKAKADALYDSDRAKLQTQTDEINSIESQLDNGSIAVDVARIRRDRESAETAYSTIATRLAKAIADRAEAASTGSVIVLDRAQFAPQDTFASGAVVAAGIVFITLWLALTLALMLESASQSLSNEVTIQAIYGTKLIGSLA